MSTRFHKNWSHQVATAEMPLRLPYKNLWPTSSVSSWVLSPTYPCLYGINYCKPKSLSNSYANPMPLQIFLPMPTSMTHSITTKCPWPQWAEMHKYMKKETNETQGHSTLWMAGILPQTQSITEHKHSTSRP